jgi:PKD domain/Secretion system C-terminal sorting domain
VASLVSMAMKKFHLLILFYLSTFTLVAQKYDYNWLTVHYEKKPGTNLYPSYNMNFETSPPTITEYLFPFGSLKTRMSLSDKDGNPQLFSNGRVISNFNGEIINNGSDLHTGVISSTSFSTTSSLGISGLPEYLTENFNIFHRASTTEFNDYLKYTKINKNTSDYEVEFKNRVLFNQEFLGVFNSTRHGNGKDWWVSCPVFKPTNTGVNADMIDSLFMFTVLSSADTTKVEHKQVFLNQRSGGFQSTFSPNGNLFASAGNHNYSDPMTPPYFFFERAYIRLFDFDRCSGLFSNPRYIDFPTTEPLNDFVNGVSFSPNSRFMYVATTKVLYQVDMFDAVPGLVLDTVAIYDGFKDVNLVPSSFLGMQLGSDGKIYMFNQTHYITYIEKPNKKGTACNVKQHSIQVPTISCGYCINFYPNYRLGPIDGSSCDTAGIDNRPLSDFWWFGDSTLMVEFADNSSYEPSTWAWDFGDGTVSQDTSPVHIFPEAGVYNVCLIVCNANACDTLCREVNVGVSGIEETANLPATNIIIYPNPAQDYLKLLIPSPNNPSITGTWLAYTINGQEIATGALSGAETKISTQTWANGVYVLYITLDGVRSVAKVVVSRL